MHIEHRNLMWTLMPLLLTGVLCNIWRVEYQQRHICAVKGSPVVIACLIYYPDNLRVKRFVWRHVKSYQFRTHFWNLKKISTRSQYIGDELHNCSLKIHKVDHNDTGKYLFIFTTDSNKGKLTDSVGSTLKVVDLNILLTNGNRTAKEGDSLNLTCINGCDGDNLSSAFTWFKNGKAINEGTVLYLSNMSSTNSGNYTCSLKTHTQTTSGVINIDVEYGPKNTSVSVRPLKEVDAGSNLTLICSSHANPPVKNYTWFKIHDDEIMEVEHQPVFFPGDGGQYFCRATNEYGSQNSSVVTHSVVKPYWATFTRDLLIIAAVAVLLIMITVIAVRRLHNKTHSEEDIQSTGYVNWLPCDNNQSQEGNQCEGGETEVIYTAVQFNRKRKSNMEQQQMDSTGEGVIYITVVGTNC